MEPFAAALAAIQSGLRQYVASRPVALQDMYLARFLPPVRSTEAEVKAGNFRITTSPAPITAVDSAYAKVGGIKVQDFNASGFKITAETKLSEANQDQMHARAQNEIVRAYNAGDSANVQSIFENFIARLMEDGVLLSLDYGEELYRALALAYGKLDVLDANTGLSTEADFKVPDTHKVKRSGNEAYDKPGSRFWDDVQTARERLNVEPVALTDPETWQAILNNPAHGILATEPVRVAPNVWAYTISQAGKTIKADGSVEWNMTQRGLDYRKSARVIVYGVKPDLDAAGYLWPKGRVSFLRETVRRVELIDGQVVQGALGVTHILPNTESGQQSTRFAKLYRPEGAEYEVIGKASQDMLPHVQEARNLFLAGTELGQ